MEQKAQASPNGRVGKMLMVVLKQIGLLTKAMGSFMPWEGIS